MTEAPAWARGYDLEFLKEVAAIFRADFKPHTYGQFGVPKERDVADALAEDSLIWAREPKGSGPVIAAAIARAVTSGGTHKDFAGRSLLMRRGDIFVKALAGSVEGVRRILGSVLALKAAAIWIEAHVENSGIVAALSASGFERVMTKIAAASDLKGMFVRGSSFVYPQALDPADAPGVKLLAPDFIRSEEQAAILAEIEAYGRGAFAQHYSGYNKRQSWTAFALRGYDPADPGFIIKPAEMSRKWKDDNPERLEARCGKTIAAQAFPTVWRVIERLPIAGLQRVRFMRLGAAGGELTRHADITDPEAGTADGKVARLHIPIASHPACVFRSWDLEGAEHRLHMPERGLSYIDTRKPHAVINPAEIERIHLVVDAFSTPELRAMIAG